MVGGSLYVGGLVGANNGTLINDAYVNGAVKGTTDVGGLVGYNDGEIVNSFATSNVVDNISGLQYVRGSRRKQ